MTMPENFSHLLHRSQPSRLAASSRGVVLVIVLLLSAVITLIVLAFSLGVGTDLRISRNDLLGKQALAVAEAGVERGVAELQALATENRATLESVPTKLSPGEKGIGPLVLRSFGTEKSFDGLAYRCVDYGGGNYCLRVVDNHDEVAAGFPLRCVTPQPSPSPYSAQKDYPEHDCDLVVTLRSRGEVGGAVRIVDLLLSFSPEPDCAIIANGNLSLSGSSSVQGSSGCVHGNSGLTLSGAMSATGQVTASSNLLVQNSGVSVGGLTLNSPTLKSSYEAGASLQPQLPVPSVRPMLFGADKVPLQTQVMNDPKGYRLDADGNIYVGPGITGNSSDEWNCIEASSDCSGGRALTASEKTALKLDGWSFSGGKWSTGAGSPVNGIYFIETPVTIGSNWGRSNCSTDPCPWRATLIALDSIQITGSPVISAYYQSTAAGLPSSVTLPPEKPSDPSDPAYLEVLRKWSLRNLLLVTGNDLELKGTGLSAQYTGGLYAHQQMKTSGNFSLTGFMYVENGENPWSGELKCNAGWDLQTCGEISLGGNFTISYDGMGDAGGAPTVRRLSWSDVK